jgi:PadR family transcriptional regulator PadR
MEIELRWVKLAKDSYCIPIEAARIFLLLFCNRSKRMSEKTDVWQGTLTLMVLKTLEAMGTMHGYGLARRIEQTSGDLLQLNYGTLYPALLKLEQEGYIRSRWGTSENNRRAKFYELTKAGQRRVRKAAAEWEQATEILARFLAPAEEV